MERRASGLIVIEGVTAIADRVLRAMGGRSAPMRDPTTKADRLPLVSLSSLYV